LFTYFHHNILNTKNTKAKKRGRQGEGGGCPRKQAQSGRTITQQLLDNVLYDTPWDNDLSGATASLSREEEACTCDMKKYIIEMAKDADRENCLIGSSPYTLSQLNLQFTHHIRLPLYPTCTF